MSRVQIPPLADLLDSVIVVALPMRTRFRGITVRESLLFRGPAGWGEFGAFVEYDDAEAAWWLAAGIEAAWDGFPTPVRSAIAVNATVPAVAADAVPDILARYPGATTAKVKVAEPGDTLDDEIGRLDAVRAIVPTVRIDANGKWTPAEAIRALTAFGDLEYAEQPCASIEELAEVRAAVQTPIAADESIRRAEDPLRVVRAGAADVAVLKVAPLGGMRRVLALAEEIDLTVVISSALDTAVGICAGVATAAALPMDPPACGLGTGSLFVTDVAEPLVVESGRASPSAAIPDGRAPLAPTRRRDWWIARLTRVHALLASGHPAARS